MNLKFMQKGMGVLLLLLLSYTIIYAQERTVTGKVVDKADGLPLPGLTVSIKGKPSNVSTDVNGSFSIKVTPADSVLVFSYIGYLRQQINVSGKNSITVTMVSSNTNLDEVVVVGYGIQKKIHLTGAVETIDVKAIEDIPVGSLSAALRGQVAGVGVSGGFSRPGSDAQITIRNPIFLSKDGGSTEPLYVIDNVIRTTTDFNLLDASEVENISILKDASAAIYGILGSNGVIVVTTKRGKSGAPKISYSGSVGVSDATQLPSMMTGVELATYLNDYNISRGTPVPAEIYAPDELTHFATNSGNWIDQAWQSSYVSRHTLNISGGTDKATFFASGTYVNQNANFKGINTDRWTFRASSDMKITKGLNLGISVSGDLSNNKRYFFKQGNESIENDFISLLGTAPFIPYYVNGIPNLLTTATNSALTNFHFFEAQNSNNYTNSRNTGMNVLANLKYDVPFVKGLRAGLDFSKNLDNNFGKQFGSSYNVYRFTMTGTNSHIYTNNISGLPITLKNGDRIRISPSYTDSYQLNGNLNYSRTFGKHQITALALFEQSERTNDAVNGMVEGLIFGGSDTQNYGTGTQTSNESASEFGRMAYAGRINYVFADKYLAELAFRADANVNFAPENQWGYFPSLSLGWVVSEEGFFKNKIKGVDFLKLRASVGILGSDNTRGFQYLTNYKTETGKAPVFNGNNPRGIVISPNVAIANRNVTWDDNYKYNAGLDTRFLENRLSVSFDGFLDQRRNVLSNLTASVPLTIGAAVPTENFGSTNSFGIELSAGWKDKINKDWSYNVNTFLSWSDNKMLIIDQALALNGTYQDALNRSSDRGVFGYKYVDMFRTPEQVTAYLAANPNYKLFGKAPEPGMLYYEDIRGPKDANGNFTGPDGVITELDQDYLTPKASNHYGLGLNLGTSYKTFSLSVVMGMSFGGQDVVEGNARKIAQVNANRPDFWKDHWTPENPDAKYPGPEFRDTYEPTSSFWFKDSFSFRMSNFNLSYGLPSKVASKIGLSNAKVFFVGTNPFNFYNPYDYRDNSSSYDVYPALKTFSLGLNVGI